MKPLSPHEYRAALYMRLSRDEEAASESNSISNQRRILTDYARQEGFRIHDEYVDDGVSGTTFDREGFRRMLSDIDGGKVNMVIVKDLSRLGRDRIATDRYMEQTFPEMGVRLIAIGDNYDSLFPDAPAADMAAIVNYFNEYHAKQTSRKTRASKDSLARAGKFQGSKAPFGYIRDPADKHHLLVDPDAMDTVKYIFQLACEGLGYKAIAGRLRDKGILNPTAYVNEKDPEHHADSEYWNQPHDWHATSVKTILHNPVYLGKIVSGKRRKKSFKSNEIVYMPEEDWIITEGTHDAIIDQRIWDMAHEKLGVRKRADNQGAIQIFAGLVKCADCGYALTFRNNPTPAYNCSQYNVKGKAYCGSHFIKYDDLYQIVLEDIRRKAHAASSGDVYFLQEIRKERAGALARKRAATVKILEQLQQRDSDLDAIIGKLYEDQALGRIAETRARTLMGRYESEQLELRERADTLRDTLEQEETERSETDHFLAVVRKYTGIRALDTVILNELVKCIEVGAKEKSDGAIHQSVKIVYRQAGYIMWDLWDDSSLLPGPAPPVQEIEYEDPLDALLAWHFQNLFNQFFLSLKEYEMYGTKNELLELILGDGDEEAADLASVWLPMILEDMANGYGQME